MTLLSRVPVLSTAEEEELLDMAGRLRRHIVHLAADSAGAHVGGSMSAVEILTVLYFGGVLRVDPKQPELDGRDYFIFSKGHCSALLYSALAERGFLPVDELATYKNLGSRLPGHPSKEIPGVELATGSLGHGLPVAGGIAWAGKYDQADYRVYVLLGDGECQEGSTWEAAMAAAHFRLDNLVVVIDRNGIQEDGPTETVMALEPFADKWRSFGWTVEEVDGHNLAALHRTLHAMPLQPGRPSAVIAHTVKGNGISFAANTNAWHYGKLTPEQKRLALEELADAGRRGGV